MLKWALARVCTHFRNMFFWNRALARVCAHVSMLKWALARVCAHFINIFFGERGARWSLRPCQHAQVGARSSLRPLQKYVFLGNGALARVCAHVSMLKWALARVCAHFVFFLFEWGARSSLRPCQHAERGAHSSLRHFRNSSADPLPGRSLEFAPMSACSSGRSGTIWNSSAESADLPYPAEVVSRSAARTPPSTRAGGQDDGSLNKLPQIRRPHRGHQACEMFLSPLLLSSPCGSKTSLPVPPSPVEDPGYASEFALKNDLNKKGPKSSIVETSAPKKVPKMVPTWSRCSILRI